MQRTRRVLLSGATGYLGRHLHRALLSRGDEVVTIGRREADVVTDFGDPEEVHASLREVAADVALSKLGSCLLSQHPILPLFRILGLVLRA